MENREGMSVFREGEYSEAHSGWIKTLTENGIPGIVLLGAFVLSFAVIGWRTRSVGLFPLGLLATVGLSVAFLADEFQAKGLWLLVATVMTALRRGATRSARTRAAATIGIERRSSDDVDWNKLVHAPRREKS